MPFAHGLGERRADPRRASPSRIRSGIHSVCKAPRRPPAAGLADCIEHEALGARCQQSKVAQNRYRTRGSKRGALAPSQDSQAAAWRLRRRTDTPNGLPSACIGFSPRSTHANFSLSNNASSSTCSSRNASSITGAPVIQYKDHAAASARSGLSSAVRSLPYGCDIAKQTKGKECNGRSLIICQSLQQSLCAGAQANGAQMNRVSAPRAVRQRSHPWAQFACSK